MAIKALITGDLHLGRRSATVPTSAEESSTRFTWAKIVDWCIDHSVDILVLTGDIIDRENRFFEAIGPLKFGFRKLAKAGISVFMIAGNHDFDTLTDVVKTSGFPNVHLLGEGGNWEMQTFEKGEEKIQFIGWSFPKENVQFDPFFQYMDINIDPNYPAIGLLHGDIGNLESNYCRINFSSLLNKGIEAWGLGHIHKPGQLQAAGPLMFYPGSPHALSSKEPGAHGAVLLDIIRKGEITATDISLSPVRYEHIEIDITGVTNKSSFRTNLIYSLYTDSHAKIAELENVAFLIYNIEIIGSYNNTQELESWKNEIIEQADLDLENGGKILIRGIGINVEPVVENMEDLAQQNSSVGILASAILSIENGHMNAVVDDLLIKVKSTIKEVNTASVYQMLYREGKQQPESDEVCKKYILKECKSLLSNLLLQTR